MKSLILLVKKDYYLTRASTGMSLLLIACIWIVSSAINPTMLVVFSAMCFYMTVMAIFAVEENNQVADINHILPVSRRQQVNARYLYAWIVSLGISVMCLLLPIVGNLLLSRSYDPLILAGQALGQTLVMGSLSIPINYRFGATKSRIYTMFLYILAIIPGFVIFEADSAMAMMLVFLGTGILLTPISLALTWRIVDNKK